MNCKQDHNDNDIRHIFIKNMQWTTQIYQLREKKNKNKNEIKYLLAWIYASTEEYFRNRRNFYFFEIKNILLIKKKFLEPSLLEHL